MVVVTRRIWIRTRPHTLLVCKNIKRMSCYSTNSFECRKSSQWIIIRHLITRFNLWRILATIGLDVHSTCQPSSVSSRNNHHYHRSTRHIRQPITTRGTIRLQCTKQWWCSLCQLDFLRQSHRHRGSRSNHSKFHMECTTQTNLLARAIIFICRISKEFPKRCDH